MRPARQITRTPREHLDAGALERQRILRALLPTLRRARDSGEPWYRWVLEEWAPRRAALRSRTESAPASSSSSTAGAASWGSCTCGHPIYDHGRVKYSGNPSATYAGCGEPDCPCLRFAAGDGSRWPYGPAGVPG